MADEYDGEITLSVNMDTKQVTQTANRLSKTLQDLFAADGPHRQTKAFQAWQVQVDKVVNKSQELSSQLHALENQQIPTENYINLKKEIEKAEQALLKLYNRREAYEEINKAPPAKLGTAITAAEEQLERLEKGMQELVDTGKAFTLGKDTNQFQNLTHQLNEANNQMVVLQTRGADIIDKNAEKLDGKLIPALKRTQSATAKVFNTHNKGFTKLNLGWDKLIKKILMYGFGIRSIYFLFNRLRSAVMEGIKNLTQFKDGNNSVNDAMSELASSTLYLKNAMAAMIAPILEVVIPVLTQFMDILSDATNRVGMFIAALQGKTSFTKAIKAVKDYASNISKATKKLASYDELNNVTSDKSSSEPSANDMFKEVPIDPTVIQWLDDIKNRLKPIMDVMQALIDKAKELADTFKTGFDDAWDFLNIDDQIDDILTNLSLIGQHLKDIFTDPEVLASINTFLDKVAYACGQIAASVLSIILTIVQNVVGGVEKYLAQNTERIKSYLVEMFNVWGDIYAQLGEFFVAFANIFQAFGSNEGQQLTANLIGIFADAFMGINLLLSKFALDFLTLFTQPIIDNQEQLKAVLTDFLGFLSEITGTIKDFIDSVVDKANEVYDKHLHPLFESLTKGISNIVQTILDVYNKNIKPLLDKFAKNFDELFKNHLQPLISRALELIGKVADALKVLWETVLQPFIQWFITTIMPAILPALDTILSTVINVVGDIADIIGGFITILEGVIDFLLGVFTGDWDRAWQGILEVQTGILEMLGGAWNAIVDVIAGALSVIVETMVGQWNVIVSSVENALAFLNEIFRNFGDIVIQIETDTQNNTKDFVNNILEFFEGLANGVVDAINTVINALNGLEVDVPDWVTDLTGIDNFGFNIPNVPSVNIPRLAQGAVIPPNKEFLAMLGDQSHGTNVEAPLETIQEALYNALIQAGIGQNNEDIVIQLDGREIARAVRREDSIFRKSTGESMFSY